MSLHVIHSDIINTLISGCLSSFQLPNVISPQKINISSSADLDEFDLDEQELDDLALASTVNDQRLFTLSQPLIRTET